MRPAVAILAGLAAVSTAYVLLTGQVQPEGSLGDSYLVLKPAPSLERAFGGGEEGAWARRHPGEPPPWWQAERPSLYLGDWENGATVNGRLNTALLLTLPVSWLALSGVAISGLRRRRRRAAAA